MMETDNNSQPDDQAQISVLKHKISELDIENKKIRDEFDVQRAKMKDLFLLKEEEFSNERSNLVNETEKLKNELGEIRSQLLICDMKRETDVEDEKRKADEQIATLEHIVNETVEESTCSRKMYETEVEKLRVAIRRLQEENRDLRSTGQQSSPHHSVQESTSLAPSVMLSAVTKTLARKLGADTFSTQENLEESMRRAQEDADMLRDLLLPLEEEIKALKDKLRATDEQLQRCIACGHNPPAGLGAGEVVAETFTSVVQQDIAAAAPGDSATALSPVACDMCCNYETQLQREQVRNSELEQRLLAAEKAMERQKEDLLKEIGFRKDMEEKWNEKREEHKLQLHELNRKTLCAEQDLHELRMTYNEYCLAISEQLRRLSERREAVQKHLDLVQQENHRLVGKFTVHSQTLQNEPINLPDTLEELQEKVLKLREDWIVAVIGKEEAQRQEENIKQEIIGLQTELATSQSNLEYLRQQYQQIEKEKAHSTSVVESFNEREKRCQEQLTTVQTQFEGMKSSKRELEESNKELRHRVSSLQEELANNETVQKDFVRLSQNLQVQLEKIRDSDTQVRWQHEDDACDCAGCHSPFPAASGGSGGRRALTTYKHNCLHCGQIYCANCLSHSVPSGPKGRPAPVCDVCHTLLVRDSAPYFSTEPPPLPN